MYMTQEILKVNLKRSTAISFREVKTRPGGSAHSILRMPSAYTFTHVMRMARQRNALSGGCRPLFVTYYLIAYCLYG